MKKMAKGMEMTILAKLELGDRQQLFSDRIYERGLVYYEDEAVHDIERTGNKITAAVDGSETYTVTLYVKADAVYNMTCTCPYAAKGEHCKHMVAVLLALEDGQLQEEPETDVEGYPAIYAGTRGAVIAVSITGT